MTNSQSNAGRKGKYTEELVTNICQKIAETGSDRLAYETYGVAHQTFYKWMKLYPEFQQQVEKARQEFQQKGIDSASDNVKLANDFIHQVLSGTFFKKKIKQVLDRNGEIQTLEELEQVIPNEFILERVMGRSSSESNVSLTVEFGLSEPSKNEEEV